MRTACVCCQSALFVYWTAWSVALWLMVYVSASRLESRSSPASHGETCKTLSAEGDVSSVQHRHVSGDASGIDLRHHIKTDHVSTAAGWTASSTVVRKQFHVVAVAVFLPGLLVDVGVLRVAVSCSLVVLVMLEVSAGDTYCNSVVRTVSILPQQYS